MKFRFPDLFDAYGMPGHTVRSLKLVIWAVAFGIVNFNIITGIAMAGYLRAVGVNDFVFGLLYAIGPALSPLQLLGSYLLERTQKRKGILIAFGMIHRIVWLPFGLVPFFVPMDQITLQIWMLALFLFLAAFAGPFLNVSFFSLAADLVPGRIRGRYFAVRMRVFTITGIMGGILTAWLLDSFPAFYSYALVFALASVTGILEIVFYFGVKFPEMTRRPKNDESLNFMKMLGVVVRNRPYMRFIFFMTLWLFSLNLAGPFILVHLHENVLLSNTLITVFVQILPNICSVLILARWGRALDAHGNKTVMQVANGILCAAPFLWIFTTNNFISIVLIILIGFMTGLLLPGFDLGANNIMMGHAPKVNRSMYIALYFTCTSIIGVGLGNATGGWLLEHVFSRFEEAGIVLLGVTLTRFGYLFALTALLRCFIVYIALPRMVKEESAPFVLLKEAHKATRRIILRRRAYLRYLLRRGRVRGRVRRKS